MPKRPPKKWFYAMVARLKKEYPEKSGKDIAKIAGGIWNKQYSWMSKARIVKAEHHSPTTIKIENPEHSEKSQPQEKSETYEGWANWDTWELWLILSNDEQLYRWLLFWHRNFKLKQARGTFDQDKARSVVKKYLIPVARGSKKLWFKDLTTDPDIDKDKVDLDEIIEAILKIEYEPKVDPSKEPKGEPTEPIMSKEDIRWEKAKEKRLSETDEY